MSELKEFVTERDKALETRSIDELIKFMDKWVEKGYYDKRLIDRFRNQSHRFQLGSMCKMIMDCNNISKETKKWAYEQLQQLGYSPKIN